MCFFRIFLISILLSFFLIPVSAQDKPDTVDIDEVVFSGQRIPVVYSNLSRVVHVVQKDQMENTPVQSYQELFEYIPGVDIRQRGMHGVQGDLSIRGGSFDQNMVLLNGMPMNDPQTGHHNLNIPIGIEQITQLEVLQGPGSRIFGPNAFSGAVNFITFPSEKKDFTRFSAAGGQHGYLKASLHGAYSLGDLWSSFSFGRHMSDGYTKNTDFDRMNLYYQSALPIAIGELHFQLGHQDKEFGANQFYTPKYPDQFEHTRTTLSSISFKTRGKFSWNSMIYWRRHRDRFELFRNDSPDWYTSHNYHQTEVYGGKINLKYTSSLGKTSLGTELKREEIMSNVLGEPLQDTLQGDSEKAYYTHSAGRDNMSFFLEHSYNSSSFAVSGGALVNHSSDYGWKLYPGIEASYDIGARKKIYASVNHSLRLPTFTDLYYEGPTNLGNSDLKPEEALTYETGIQSFSSGLKANLSFFYRQGKNIIDWVRMSDSLLWKSLNHTRLSTYGAEFSGKLNGNDIWGTNPWINTIRFGYTYIQSDKESGEYQSAYSLDYLKHKAYLDLRRLFFNGKFGINLIGTLQDRAGQYVDFDSGSEVSYPPVFLLDVRFFYNLENWYFYVEANNITDKVYQDLGNIEMPGRWLRAGLSLNLNF